MTAEALPDRSLEQRMDALANANAIRSARSAFKRVLRDGTPVEARHRVAEMVATKPAPEFASMKVWDLLIACPRLGRVKVNRLLVVARVSPSKTLAGLSDRQRDELSRAVLTSAPYITDAERVG